MDSNGVHNVAAIKLCLSNRGPHLQVIVQYALKISSNILEILIFFNSILPEKILYAQLWKLHSTPIIKLAVSESSY